jgi:hypothetical protein
MLVPTINRPVLFVPAGQFVQIRICQMTEPMAVQKITLDWWHDPALINPMHPDPIDRDWDWSTAAIEFDDQIVPSVKVAAVTGDDAVQGAMMISAGPVASVLAIGEGCLFVELLFAAPRNRASLRRDGKPYLQGIGSELLPWGAWFSRKLGHAGRLRLDGSPDFLPWYEKRFATPSLDPIVYQRVSYTPMELPPSAAERLLTHWPP